MTVRDIYTSTDDNQKLSILENGTNRTIWAGIADNIQYELLNRYVSKISCSGQTIIITVDPE